jgi:ABC-type transporter Mla maintaining outer membrane lipid asymmetry ATPase subunit MlaF
VTPILELSGVVKDYRGLRPLRVDRLVVAPADQLAIVGLDQISAEIFINLVTGATLPDSGEIRAFGRPTASIQDSTEWMALVDRFGIVSERAVLLDGLTVIQNLAVPFSLDIEPPSEEVRAQAAKLANEVGLSEVEVSRRVGDLDSVARMRVRLGRALALGPSILLLEHPSAAVPRGEIGAFGGSIRAILERRGAAALTLSADREFAAAVSRRVLTLDAANGRLSETRTGWFAKTPRTG